MGFIPDRLAPDDDDDALLSTLGGMPLWDLSGNWHVCQVSRSWDSVNNHYNMANITLTSD